MLIKDILLTLIASFLLIKAVSLFIDSSSKISQSLGISGYTISFLLVSMATSLPELMVGINSAIANRPILSYGNALGSNVALLTLIIAIPGFINSGLHTRKIFRSKDIYISCFFAILAVALGLDGKISRLDGSILLTGYVFYSISFIKKNSSIQTLINKFENINFLKELLLFIMSLCLIILSSEIIVRSAIGISETLGIGLGFIGLSLTALGTSLPEIGYSIGLIKQHKQNEVLGNVVGSVSVNATVVLGVTALLNPILITNGGISIFTYIFMVLSVVLFLGFSKTNHDINKKESVMLLMVYFSFLVAEYFIGN